MADSQNIRDQRELLKLQQQELEGKKNLSAQEQKSLNLLKSQIKEIDKLIRSEDRRRQINEDINKEFSSFANEFRKLSPSVKQQLGSTKEMGGVYAQLTTRAAREAAIAKNNSGVVKENAEYRQKALESAKDTLTQQASNAAQAMDELRGISEYERQRLDYEAQRSILGNENTDALIEASMQTEQLAMKTDILKDMYGQMPGQLQQVVGFAKQFRSAIAAGMGPLFIVGALIAAAVKSFTDLEDGAKKFREETGLTNSQMEGIRSQTNQIVGEFAEIGLNAEDVFNTSAALVSQFGDVSRFSDEVVASLSVMGQNFGVSAENAAKVQGILESVGGLSSETAASVQMQVAEMSNLAGVAPAKIFEDIAENAEIASTYFQGDVEALTKAAIQARRLGTNLKSVASTTEHLLDFQSNIGDELVAATFVGGQFSLTQARTLAAAGKMVEAQDEVLKQLNRAGDFREKDYFTQQQLAKAAGMEVSEINRLITNREKLNSLSAEQRKLADEAISQGLDISNINKEDLASQVESFSKQQEQQAVLEKISNQFMGIASTVGSVLVPILDAVAVLLNVILSPIMLINDVFSYIGEKISNLIGPLGTVGKLLKGLAGLAIVYAAYKAYASLATIPIIGVGLGIAASAAILSAGFGLLSKVGDLGIDPNGGPIVASPKEGGLFQGTKNDGLMMAPGIGASTFANMAPATGVSTLANSVDTGDVSDIKTFANSGNPGGGVSDRKLDELIAAVKETKDVYMDGKRVTSNISRAVDKSTKNNFAFGT